MVFSFFLNFKLFNQGILLLNPKVLRQQSNDDDTRYNSLKIIKLWTHETYRVFADRLVDPKDRAEFFKTIKVKNIFFYYLLKYIHLKIKEWNIN